MSLAEVEVVDVRVEPLTVASVAALGHEPSDVFGVTVDACEVQNEGFTIEPSDFAEMWATTHGYRDAQWARKAGVSGVILTTGDALPITCRRIQWRYLTVICPKCQNWRHGTVPGHEQGSNWDFVPCGHCVGGFIEVAL